MTSHGQIIHNINIIQLKNIFNVCISFEGSPLVGLMGVNGSGKSTILHALACVYKPIEEQQTNYKFTRYFPPTCHFDWSESEFCITHTYHEKNQPYERKEKTYKKGDRWTIYERRPERYVRFIEIKTCVPVIETETKGLRIEYGTTIREDAVDREICAKAGYILNKNYDNSYLHEYGAKAIVGVKDKSTQYSALTMGAGEQRVFAILDAVFKIPRNNALILIDEIDLLMHPEALRRLIEVLYDRAKDKCHQIIFTSHSLELFELKKLVELRYIYQTNLGTLCIVNTTPDIHRRMTGKAVKPLEIYVEDRLAEAIVEHIVNCTGMSKDVSINKVGSAFNIFTVAGGLALSGKSINNLLFVIDGDVYVREKEKKKQIEKVVTGHGTEIEKYRDIVLKNIVQFNLPELSKPEKFIFDLIREIEIELNQKDDETRQIANDIINAGNHHNLVTVFAERIGIDELRAMERLITVACLSSQWSNFSDLVQTWLEKKKKELY